MLSFAYATWKSLTNIKYNIDNVIQNREQNLTEFRQQRQIFHDQVKQMRVKINSHLDTLEQNILKELLSLPLPQSPYFLERFAGLRHTL
jgi:predicted DNA-binding protein (UPF0278 family)